MSSQESSAQSARQYAAPPSLEAVKLYCEQNEVKLRDSVARVFCKLAVAVADATAGGDSSEIAVLSASIPDMPNADRSSSWIDAVSFTQDNEFVVELNMLYDDARASFRVVMELKNAGIKSVEFEDADYMEDFGYPAHDYSEDTEG